MEEMKIIALRNGDHKAFEAIFILYFRRVKIFINGIIKSEADAEELAQEVFVKLWVNRERIDIEKSFNAYLYMIARNSAFNHLKHKAVKQTYLDTFQPLNSIETPEDICFVQEINLLVEMTVNQMPAQRKRIYVLSRNEGVSNDDIAIQLSISKKTIENQLSLALKELKGVLNSLFILFF